ncbi:TcdA/TcdB catalytic glycosyltransferase domain-containing protein [Haliangium sp.]|uniref:TcdA/TcdB catalytic glycosyltransferase domain-containing protein n=1 Tax=Haliangium sp. TaxID=2663208 RepID=UPI003D107031
MLKRINDELASALEAKDKVVVRRVLRQLELYLESATLRGPEPSQIVRAKTLAQKARSFLQGKSRRLYVDDMGIGPLRPRDESTPEQRMLAELEKSTNQARSSTRNQNQIKLENIPKIFHCTWAGGGAIDKVKSLDGVKSWLTHTDYKVFVWWDSEQLFNMHVRKLLKANKQVRRLYDDSAFLDKLEIRRSARPGSNQHHHRFLTQVMGNFSKFETHKELWDEVEHDLEPLRQLQEDHPKRIVLCDVRAKGLPQRGFWTNLLHYERELTYRGMFAAAASDILRYEVVYHFGGVYMDVDIELTGDIGQLQAHPDSLLAGITPDRKGKAPVRSWTNRKLIATTKAYNNKCLYISNCIVAACPQSRAMNAVRETIRLAYGCVATPVSRLSRIHDPKKLLSKFWRADTTRSTLDLTGPNVVREVLYQVFQDVGWDSVARCSVIRLVSALSKQNDLGNMPKDIGSPFCRIDYVWRDDLFRHQEFWSFMAQFAAFPMAKVVCDTDAAERSDCRTASNQVSSNSLRKLPLKKLHPYLPTITKDEKLKAPWDTFHVQHKRYSDEPLPPVERVGQVIRWAHAYWKVTAIDKTRKNRDLEQDKWRIELRKLD